MTPDPTPDAMTPWLVRVSKTTSRALRHEPEAFGLALDPHGWVPLADLVAALRARGPRFAAVDADVLARIGELSDKTRFEIADGRIRALYGHSVPARVVKDEAVPPPVLLHGTSPAAWARIAAEGLRPMARQYVHLAHDEPTARAVGLRHHAHPVLLEVDAAAAHRAGTRFWHGNGTIWLAETVDPRYVRYRPWRVA